MAGTASLKRKLSVAEAADYHGCSERTIRRAIASGRLRAYRVGPRMIRIDPRDPEDAQSRYSALRTSSTCMLLPSCGDGVRCSGSVRS